MRLIDADALKDKVVAWLPPDPCGIEEREYLIETDIIISTIMEIEEAPTIEVNEYADKDEAFMKGVDDE